MLPSQHMQAEGTAPDSVYPASTPCVICETLERVEAIQGVFCLAEKTSKVST